MAETIDPKFVEMVVQAKRDGTLEVDELATGGANLKFKYLQTDMKMLLGQPNWEIVKAALERTVN